jgi:N6-adenosine-specific RNA methylase IME4/ParB-like chromosome segregation protein Spo0J
VLNIAPIDTQPLDPRAAPNGANEVSIVGIVIGQRHRRDVGDVSSLAASIADIGLLHPIVIDRRTNRLVAGERRLRAFQSLGRERIPATLVDFDEIVRGEFAENAERKDFLPSEIEAIRRSLEPIEREAAKRRQAMAGGSAPGNFPEAVAKGQTRDRIGAFAGISGRTVEKIAAVVRAAEAEPERYGHLVEEMDRYRGVDRAYRALRIAQDERRILNLMPIVGKHRSLVVDIPWKYDMDFLGRGAPQYALMSDDEARALPVPSWAEDDCHLYLWTTNALMPKANALITHWGFDHKTIVTWKKPHYGLGAYFRGQTEHVLFAVRGSLGIRRNDIPTIFEAPVGEHSEKPEKFYEIVRAASYPPYGEAFQRKPRPDFVNLFAGDEVQREAAE